MVPCPKCPNYNIIPNQGELWLIPPPPPPPSPHTHSESASKESNYHHIHIQGGEFNIHHQGFEYLT